jgi:hypothetical protein
VRDRLCYRYSVRWVADEAGGARCAPSSSGLPRGTQAEVGQTPQALDCASRSTAPALTDRSPAIHRLTFRTVR